MALLSDPFKDPVTLMAIVVRDVKDILHILLWQIVNGQCLIDFTDEGRRWVGTARLLYDVYTLRIQP